MKNNQRKVHINDEQWVYVIDKDIRIYDPNKKMTRINHTDLGSERHITPSVIKSYIETNLINAED